MESILETTENIFWLEVIRKSLKLSQGEIVESDWGGEQMFVGNWNLLVAQIHWGLYDQHRQEQHKVS